MMDTEASTGQKETEQPTPLPSQPTEHPLFHTLEALTSQGDWLAAKGPLEELMALYPGDVFLQQIADSIYTRSALLESISQPVSPTTRESILARGLKFIVPGAILIAVVGLTAIIIFALQQWIIPQLRLQRQEAQISQLRERAQAALSSGDYDQAVMAYTDLLELAPNDSEAIIGLEQAGQLRATVSLYSEAIAEMEAYHWENALSLLQQIQAEQPNYRDVPQRIAFIENQQTLANRFDQAERAFERGSYQLAIREYEALQSIDYDFEREIVQDHLFLSYLQQGLVEQTDAGNDPIGLQAALEYFEKALTLQPDDTRAKGESQLLRSYLDGLDAFNAENWSQAISELTPVYEARPDFADGRAYQLLYEAQVAAADELFVNGQVEQALVGYQEALSIADGDTSDLAQKIAVAEDILAPPTPTSTPTPTPTSTPQPSEVAQADVSTGGGRVSAPAPLPTATPKSFPFILKNMSVRPNCGDFGYIHGVVLSVYALPLAGVKVQAYNTSRNIGPFISLPTNEDGIYQIILNKDQIEGLWSVQVFENDQPASLVWGQHLGGGCQNGVQELKVDWQRTFETQ
jgi:tetratricopeptide (TPR) repeat protein